MSAPSSSSPSSLLLCFPSFVLQHAQVLTSIAAASILLCCYLLYLFRYCDHRRRSPLPVNWPVLGTIPAAVANAHRVHDWGLDILKFTGYTYLLQGPWGFNDDEVLTGDPANVAHILTTNFKNYPKGQEFAEVFDVLGDGIFNADGDSWSYQRKKAHGLMSQPKFRDYVYRSTVRKLENGLLPMIRQLAEEGRTFDLQDVFLRLTFDLTSIFVFGFDPGCLTPGFPRVPFADAMDAAEEVLFYRHVVPVPLLRLESFLRIGHEKKMSEARAVLDGCIRDYIARRKEMTAKMDAEGRADDDDDHCDLVSAYIASEAEVGKQLGAEMDEFLRDTALNIMVAGRDTTSSALTWFFWLLTKNPDVESKILTELQLHRPESNTGYHTLAQLKQLVYVHAALCESLRLYPPVPFEHKAAAEPDTLPSGMPVARNQRVIMSFYAMGRMEGIWGHDCMDFRPERWLTESGKLMHVPSCKFVAFNAGPRTCLGRDIAFTQMKAVVAAIVPRFRLEVAAAGETAASAGLLGQPKLSIILHMKGGFKVKVHHRRTVDPAQEYATTSGMSCRFGRMR